MATAPKKTAAPKKAAAPAAAAKKAPVKKLLQPRLPLQRLVLAKPRLTLPVQRAAFHRLSALLST